MVIFIFILLIFLLIFQGGFYPTAYMLVGMAGSVILIFQKRKLRITKEIVCLIFISAIYLISVIQKGISYSSLSRSMLPLVCLIVAFLYSTVQITDKKKIIKLIALLGIVSSVVAVFMYLGVMQFPGAVNAGRLQFTFQYANVAGTWFATSFILAQYSDEKKIRILSIVDILSLFLTKSAGAILILAVLMAINIVRTFINKRDKSSVILSAAYIMACICGTVVLLPRLGQAKYTFIERIIQSADGIKLIGQNLLLGIGADNWNYIYPFEQSAQYKAGIIHNSYVQAGVSAGVIPMLILIFILIKTVRKYMADNSAVSMAAVFIMLHSIIDYCLSFACIDILLIILLMSSEGNEIKLEESRISTFISKNYVKAGMGLSILLVLVFSFYGTVKVRNINAWLRTGNTNKVIAAYENDKFMRNGYAETEVYGKAVYMSVGLTKSLNTSNVRRKSSEYRLYQILQNEKMNGLSIDELISEIDTQPFNVDIINRFTEIVERGNFSQNEIEQYNNRLEAVNKIIKKKPANRLNNQKEADYAETN